jgi:alanyl-tRNA synthetase
VERAGLRFACSLAAVDTPDALRSLGSQVLGQLGEGVVCLGAVFADKATVVAFASPGAIKAGHQAGKIIGEMSALLGGKGGGKPDFAMGGGRDVGRINEALSSALPKS